MPARNVERNSRRNSARNAVRTATAFALATSLALSPLATRLTTADDQSFLGYSADSSRTERQWEEKFRAIPSTDNLRAYMQHLTEHPHNVGTPRDKEYAEWIAAKFKAFGLDTHIEQFDVLYPTPKERVVELVDGGPKFSAKLQEPAVPGDPTSNQQNEQLPTYHAYSIDGDVTAPLVYVNYGIPEDYEQLDRMGISVKGKIVIARYYHSWRGIKPKVAAEHGAIGCLIYSDPHEDGFVQGETFPQGAWRPKDGVQRGSVADMPFYAGDPLTPGVGATKDAKRLKVEESPTITKIPVLPISYADAQPLLAALTGRVPPADWRGGLGMTYRVGPGPAKVHLKVKSNWDIKPVYDVIAKIPGSTAPDEWVMRGNHHDAWVNGAEDPISGLDAVLEEARAMSELLKQGWKPKRTIIFTAWDGEEPGLLGSTECAEEHADELKKHAVAYINSDTNGRGYLFIEGSHTLEKFTNEVSKDITDPETKLSAWKRNQLREIANRAFDRGASGSPPACRSAHRRARFRLRLHRVSATRRRRQRQSRLRRRRRRRHLPFHLRRFLLVHAFQRHRFRLRPRARANRRHDGDAPRRRRPAAVRIHRFQRHDPDLHQGAESPRDEIA